MSIRVFLADDHPIVREGLRFAIEAGSSDIQIVGEASAGLATLETAGKLGVDVYILDVSMPVLNGIETTQGSSERTPGARSSFSASTTAARLSRRPSSAAPMATCSRRAPPMR